MGLVYHYTSPEGALGILQNKTLWFTDCEFLNDPAELAYCYALYDQAWVDVCRERGVPDEQIERNITHYANPYECESGASDYVGAYVPARYYVLSTSLDSDSALMWANYSVKNNVAGYALAFEQDTLIDTLQKIAVEANQYGVPTEVLSGQVCYDREKQLEVVRCAIRQYLEEMDSAAARSGEFDRITSCECAQIDHWAWFRDFTPFIKRPEFVHEQECRFVLKTAQLDRLPGSPIVFRFRKGFAGAVTPYLAVKLGDSLKSALMGVQGHSHFAPNLVKDGVTQLIKTLGYEGISVRMSSLQLRG